MQTGRSRLKELWRLGREIPETERGHWLDSQGEADAALRAELESLWAADRDVGDFLNKPALAGLPGKLGVWQPIRKIGSGGMGVVYQAVRAADGIEQQAAIKMIERGKTGETTLRRFQQERQILARLDHPAIARLLDGGQDSEGNPYLVMEFVHGLPLDVWLKEKAPDAQAKLLLFEQICAAVQYAHQRLVVHRDLKPANILVRADSTPKLLDFGIAKFLPEEGGSATLMFWTPDYASPEQKRGEPPTTASDIYSLGRILKGIFPEVAPPNKDLDAIVAKTLRDDPEDRYGSASALAEDVARFRRGLPVLARPISTSQQVVKFVGRNKLGSALGLAALAAVLIAAAVAFYERNQARDMFRTSRAIAGRMIWDVDEALRNQSPTIARATLLEQTVRYLDELSKSPRRDLAFTLELAESYRRLGSAYSAAAAGGADKSLAAYQAASNLLEGNSPGVQFVRGKVETGLAQAFSSTGKPKEAERHARLAVEILDALATGPDSTPDARTNRVAAYITLGDTIVKLVDRETLEAMRRKTALLAAELDPARPSTKPLQAQAEKRLAAVLWVQKKHAEAMPHSKLALRLDEEAYVAFPGPDQQRNLATSLSETGGLHLASGKTEEGLPYIERSLDLRRKAVAADPQNGMGRFGLANILQRKASGLTKLKRKPEAAAALREAEKVAVGPPVNTQMLKSIRASLAELALK